MVTDSQGTILVVDDEENLRHMLQVMLRKQGYQVDCAVDGDQALSMVQHTSYDFILCDVRMPGVDGPEFLRRISASGLVSTVIMMSAYGTIDMALLCMKLGAYDYISKPFKSDEVLLVLRKAEERENLRRENRRLREELALAGSWCGIIGKSPSMQVIFSLIDKVCDHKTTVLVLGESGTGKEMVARAIHCRSARRSAPFVGVNCGAIPEQLLESELFGHVKGAFTDAVADKSGLFSQAHGGTLFLDEIGDMPQSLQVKLLRVLQEGEIRPVGSNQTRKVDVRVVSATSRDLARDVIDGRFREDLYYRLNVFTIQVPPLRERISDIPVLIDHFLAKHAEHTRKSCVRLSAEAFSVLMHYHWPGNVRELENCLERCLILCDSDEIGVSCLPSSLLVSVDSMNSSDANNCFSLKQASELLERDFIIRALEHTGGNRTQAAKLLEISHRALLYKIKDYQLG